MTPHGGVAPGFEPVLAQFRRNLEETETGAAFAVVHEGRLVVDLWGGTADAAAGRPWAEDTSTLIYSGTKGVVATTLLWLCDRGILDLDAPVSRYWPEFAAGGKERVTVGEAATYTGGVPAVRAVAVDQDMLGDARLMASLVAAEEIVPDPPLAYGPFTMGWIVDELCLRTTGRELREVFRDEIADPLGLTFGWGEPGVPDLAAVHYERAFTAQYDRYTGSDDPLVRATWANPVPFPHGDVVWNAPSRRAAYIPAGNGAGTARSIARLYATLVDDLHGDNGPHGRIASPARVADAIALRIRQVDAALGFPFAYGRGGFRRRSSARPGIDGDMFGHDGGGGSAHFAWPAARVALSYTPNRLLDLGNDDHRAGSLIRALKASLAGGRAEGRGAA